MTNLSSVEAGSIAMDPTCVPSILRTVDAMVVTLQNDVFTVSGDGSGEEYYGGAAMLSLAKKRVDIDAQ